LLHKLFF